MSKQVIAIMVIAAMIASLGCYRTRYINFVDPTRTSAVEPLERKRVQAWQNFWFFGWLPISRVIDAAAACGSVENIQAIETEMTFGQGLLNWFAGYIIVVYTPYTGSVICKDDPIGPRRTGRP